MRYAALEIVGVIIIIIIIIFTNVVRNNTHPASLRQWFPVLYKPDLQPAHRTHAFLKNIMFA